MSWSITLSGEWSPYERPCLLDVWLAVSSDDATQLYELASITVAKYCGSYCWCGT